MPTHLQHRIAELDSTRADDAERIVPATISTSFPVDRGGYVEVLAHDARAINLERAPLPVIEDHDNRVPVAVAENLRTDGERLRADIRFGVTARARELYADVKAGVIRNLSIGYSVDDYRDEGQRRVVTRFTPFEVSIVGAPADPNAQFFRNKPMTDISLFGGSAADVRAERERCATIMELATRHNLRELGERAIADGTPLDQFRGAVLDKTAVHPIPVVYGDDLGMTPREQQRFSVLRVARALADPRQYGREAGLENEVSRALAKQSGREARGFLVPLDLLLKRDLSTSIATGTSKAGYNVATDLMADQFVDVLRNASVTLQAGARLMTGLVGNVSIPRRTAGATVAWVAEGSAASEGTNTFDQIVMSPKSATAWVDVTRRLMLQATPGAEQLVRDDLMSSIMSAVDAGALGAAITNGPTGIRGTSGIGSVAMATNGAAPTWASIASLVREVAVDNALTGNLAFITNEKVRAKLSTTPRQASGVEGNFILDQPDRLMGYRFLTTNAVPSTLTKGSSSVCSAMIFGNFADLIVGLWSGVDITVDPYSESTRGTVRLVAFQDVDVAVRHPESFAVVADYLT